MAGNLTVETCGEVFAPTARQASCNYSVGTDGRIGMYVEEGDASWCTSSSSNDNRAITIEVANDGGESTGWHVSDQALDSLIKLCADICRRNNIEKLMWKNNKNLIGDVSKQNMTIHQWFHPTACPGPYLLSKHSHIMIEVNKLLKVPYNESDLKVPGSPVSSSNPSNAAYNYVDPVSLVDTTKITPYIATLDDKVIKVDYDKLKATGVVGVMLHGGSYYDTMHRVRKLYRADNIKEQVKEAEASEMPYALYVDVRAKSVEEAKLECNQLWYLISKYPPKLGLWLRLHSISSKAMMTRILKEYYDHFIKWGMKGQCGLYITRKQLGEIDWETLYDDYSLWLIDPVSSMVDVDNTLLTPEFFMIEEGT